jgi:hypothetical protein
MSGVVRMLRWYERAPHDQLVGETAINAELDELQVLFGVTAVNPMYDCWPVGPTQAAVISAAAGVPVDLSHFDYFVEADAAGLDSLAEGPVGGAHPTIDQSKSVHDFPDSQ